MRYPLIIHCGHEEKRDKNRTKIKTSLSTEVVDIDVYIDAKKKKRAHRSESRKAAALHQSFCCSATAPGKPFESC